MFQAEFARGPVFACAPKTLGLFDETERKDAFTEIAFVQGFTKNDFMIVTAQMKVKVQSFFKIKGDFS